MKWKLIYPRSKYLLIYLHTALEIQLKLIPGLRACFIFYIFLWLLCLNQFCDLQDQEGPVILGGGTFILGGQCPLLTHTFKINNATFYPVFVEIISSFKKNVYVYYTG